MRYLALDYGLERTGLAVSDPEEKLVFPLKTLTLAAYGNRKAFLSALVEEISAACAEAIVLGLPLQEGREESLICRQIRNFAKRLSHRLDLPIYFMNEFLSSEEAWADLKALGLSRPKRKAVLDQQASVRILESFLQAKALGQKLLRFGE